VQAELIGDVGSVHGVGQILLIGENQEEGVAQLILTQHSCQLLLGLDDTFAVVAVHHEDEALRVLEIVAQT